MSNTTQNGRVPKGDPSSLPETPSLETVKKWVVKDLESAHYMLGLVLHRHPEIIEEMAQNIYDAVMRKEQGAGIDHVPAMEEAKGYAD